MATTEYGVNHPLAVKHWSKDLMKEALKRTQVFKFMGKSKNSVCQVKTELGKEAGDKVTFGLRAQLQGDGVSGDNTLEGKEEALVTYNDSLIIDQLRHAVRSDGKMSEQRVPFSVRAEARDGLADWWADRFDTWFFNQLTGNTSVTDTRFTGMQATIAPSSDNVIYSNQSSEASLTASDTFTLDLIDVAVEKAKLSDFPFRTIDMPGGMSKMVCFLHPYQVTDLRTNTNSGQWLDIQKAAMQGGNVTKNPIYTGALGEYNGVILHESSRLPSVVANTRRAVVVGSQALMAAFGQGHGKETYSWKEELFDYGNQLGVSAGTIAGMKKCQFNSIDFSSIVISTYAVAHTG